MGSDTSFKFARPYRDRSEAGQLAVADIQEEAGIPFMCINDDPMLEQSLKNEDSRRRVPIHSNLVQLGFLEYVKTIKEQGHVLAPHWEDRREASSRSAVSSDLHNSTLPLSRRLSFAGMWARR